MAAATYPVTIEQGTTFRLALTWMQPDGVTPYDLTGAQARMQVRAGSGSTVLIDVNDAGTATAGTTGGSDGQITLGGTAGTIQVRIDPSATDRLNLRRAKYDLVIATAAGDVERLIEGAVTVSASITEPTHV